MPYAQADDGVRLYYEEAGSGEVLVFVLMAGLAGVWNSRLYRVLGQQGDEHVAADIA